MSTCQTVDSSKSSMTLSLMKPSFQITYPSQSHCKCVSYQSSKPSYTNFSCIKAWWRKLQGLTWTTNPLTHGMDHQASTFGASALGASALPSQRFWSHYGSMKNGIFTYMKSIKIQPKVGKNIQSSHGFYGDAIHAWCLKHRGAYLATSVPWIPESHNGNRYVGHKMWPQFNSPRTVLQLHEFGHQILNFGSGVDVLPAMCGNPWSETSWTRGCLICFRNKDIPKQI